MNSPFSRPTPPPSFPLSGPHIFFSRTLFHPCGHEPTQQIPLERQEATRSRDWMWAAFPTALLPIPETSN